MSDTNTQRTNRHPAPPFTEISKTVYSLSMKTLFIIPLVLMSLVSFPSWSETLTMDELVERNDLYYKKFTNVPFTGEISGVESGSFKTGKKNGEWLVYHENGQLRFVENYKKGKKEGIWKGYFENGDLSFKKSYKDGKKVGESVSYHENGQLWQIANWKDGKPEGPWRMYYDSGQLWMKGNWKERKKDGLWERYYENGQLKMKENYKDGNLIFSEYFNEDGSPKQN